jgi:hypothetical protein
MVDAHAPCFAGLTTDQAGRIAEAMQGLPDDVRQFVRDRVLFIVPTAGTMAAASVRRPPGQGRVIITLPGIDVSAVVLYHEIAHAVLDHTYVTGFGLRRARSDPRIQRLKCERDAAQLAQAWICGPVTRATRR